MDLLSSILRGVLAASLMLLIGAPPVLSTVFRNLEARDLDVAQAYRPALRLVGTALIGAVLAETALVVGRTEPSEVGSFDAWVTSTPEGQAWGVFVIVALVLGTLTVVHYVTHDRVSPRRWLGTVFASALVMLVAFCWTRYSPAVESPTVAILVKFGHMTGAALWAGGLAVLAVLPTLLPRDSIDMARLVPPIIRRFSMVAIVGVTVAFVTGIVIAAWHVPTRTALVTTPYGILLTVKVGLVLVAAAIGGLNRFVLHEQITESADKSSGAVAIPGVLTAIRPQIGSDDAVSMLVRAVRLELALLVLVLGLSVALTTTVMPSYEVLESAVAVPSQTAEHVADIGFTNVLKSGAIGIALGGALMFGYELGASAAE